MMNTFTKILLTAGLALVGRAASAQQLLDNFETTRLVDYPSPQGTIAVVANPGSNGTNTSATVGSFVRDGSQYSTVSIQLKNAARFASVAAYVAGTKRITLKFRSAAPAGTAVQLVLQNRAKAIVTPYVYPQGNFSGVFNATTTAAANTWETLTFTYAAATSDATVAATDIDQIAMLIAQGTTSTATYYFDDLMGPELSTTATPVVTDQLLDNHEGTRVIKYKRNRSGGAFRVDTLNPYKVTANMSNNVFRYSRSTQQYDGLYMGPVGAPIADVTPFVSNAKQMTLRVYSPAVGTRFQITMQDSTSANTSGYPTGRHSEYLATTTTANAWENLVFSFSNRPDANISNTGVNELVLLINSNTTQGLKLYMDDFYGPHLTNYVPTATRQVQTATAALGSPYPNPSAGVAHLPFSLKQAATVSLAVYDQLGRRVAQVLDGKTYPAGEQSADIQTAHLAAGLYTCRLVVDGAVLSRPLSVE
ncbi:MAG: T9SS type A sorting domain-containing protein [Hymenobacter sp.]|nr:MAG: T9SS type A sorting domain-containing protein [Hymenobacter sp.]